MCSFSELVQTLPSIARDALYAGAMMGVSLLAVMANSLLLQMQRPVVLRTGAGNDLGDTRGHAHVVELTPEQEREQPNALQRFGSKSLV